MRYYKYVAALVTIPTFWKYTMADKKWEKSKIYTLVANFSYNVLNNTDKANNNLRVHTLVTRKEKKTENLKNVYFLKNDL